MIPWLGLPCVAGWNRPRKLAGGRPGHPPARQRPARLRLDCRNFPPARATAHILPSPPVISAMIPPVGFRSGAAFQAASGDGVGFARVRHAICKAPLWCRCPDRSQDGDGSVNSFGRSAKTAVGHHGGSWQRRGVDRTGSARHRGWNHGAARNEYCKRTRVRVACGGTIRPRGVGILSSHGHFGRLVVGSFLPPVVPEPAREDLLRRRHLSSGPRLPATTLTASSVGFVRMSASADRAARATRPSSTVVTRAAPVPAPSVGVSGGWRERTRPDPRTRLRRV